MRLPTYNKLNIKTKRLGIYAEDVIKLVPFTFAGLVFQSVWAGIVSVSIGYFYFAFVKPTKPDGWFQAVKEYMRCKKVTFAGLELKE